jgi:biopolymer transport protein ExbD
MSRVVDKMMAEKSEVNMTPMIDVVFLLLIFFMVVVDMTQKDLADLTLPIAITAEPDKSDDRDPRYIVNVDRQGLIKYKGADYTLGELKQLLNRLKRIYGKYKDFGKPPNIVKASELFVLVRADKDTPWQHVQWIMTIMAEEKLYKLQFGAKQYADGDYLKPANGGPVAGMKEVESLGGEWKEN